MYDLNSNAFTEVPITMPLEIKDFMIINPFIQYYLMKCVSISYLIIFTCHQKSMSNGHQAFIQTNSSFSLSNPSKVLQKYKPQKYW